MAACIRSLFYPQSLVQVAPLCLFTFLSAIRTIKTQQNLLSLIMFNALGKKLSSVLSRLRNKSFLSESDVTAALREVRIALLEADVALPAVKAFMNDMKEKAIGEKIVKSISPDQMVIKLIHDALITLLSHDETSLRTASNGCTIIVLAGLQGSGKTTMAGKLAWWLSHHQHKKVLLASLDTYRPAAQEQLSTIAASIQVNALPIVKDEKPLTIARRALDVRHAYDFLILDTAGRLQKDDAMMKELQNIVALAKPHEVLFIADALSGQDALTTASAFQEACMLTGVCLSRVDGDSRGGVALSVRHCTGKPIKFMGTGELPKDIQIFDPRRIADRILDKGDIVSLVEKATQVASLEDHERTLKRMQKGIFTLDDLAEKLIQIQTMGGLKGLIDLLPGMRGVKETMEKKADDKKIMHQLAIIRAMTPKERRMPSLLNASRKRRIALGSGLNVSEVNKVLAQHEQMQKMMKSLGGRFKF